MMDGIAEEIASRTSDKKLNEAVLAALPADPLRGSYYWWARLCREYTGAHFLDSGGAYGRMHSRPIAEENAPALIFTYWRPDDFYYTISLPHWLTMILDAADERAVQMHELLHWYGSWARPRDAWYKVIRDFPEFVGTLEDMIGDDGLVMLYKVKMWLTSKIDNLDHYDRPYSWAGQTTADLVYEAIAEFPDLGEDAWWLADANPRGRGDNTYNHGDDFSQCFQWSEWEVDGRMYVIIQTHNGADVRGGYSRPVFARVVDEDYFYEFHARVDGYELNSSRPTAEQFLRWYGDREQFKIQLALPGIEIDQPDAVVENEKQALFIKQLIDEHDPGGGEWEWPVVILDNGDGSYRLPNSGEQWPAELSLVWTNENRWQATVVWHPVWGF